MGPERLLLIFERSPEEPRLLGVDEAIRTLVHNEIDVKAMARNRDDDGLFARALRFWFPYLSREGIIGVTPGAALGPATEVGEFVVTLAPVLGPAFGAALGAWVQDCHGRRVRVKFDDIELEAQTPEQVETLLSRLEASRQNRSLAQSGKK